MSLDADGRSTKTGMTVHPEGEFHVTAAATGNDRLPTADSRQHETCRWYDVDERSRRRPGRSTTRTNWLGQYYAALGMPRQQPSNPHALAGAVVAEKTP